MRATPGRPRLAPATRAAPRPRRIAPTLRAAAAPTAADAAPTISEPTRRAFDQVAKRGVETQGECENGWRAGWWNGGATVLHQPLLFFTAAGAGGQTTLDALLRADAGWKALCDANGVLPTPARPFVTVSRGKRLGAPPAFDVAVVGGTLGSLLAAAIAAAAPGARVAVIEGGPLAGRAQEWNICRAELDALVAAGCLSRSAADASVCAEFNPVRAAFGGAAPYVTRDVLNLGVRPGGLLDGAVKALTARGGVVMDNTPLTGATVFDDGVSLDVKNGDPITARLVVDATGSRGPFVAQARAGQKVDGACMVVGTCARAAWPDNDSADVIAAPDGTGAPGAPQLFWEAFPARGEGSADARTTYMFQYVSRVAPGRQSLVAMLDDYWARLSAYQGLPPDAALEVDRILFGVFTAHRASPLAPTWDRVLHAGDASGLQSPLSFGGLGALSRHAGRIAAAVADALAVDALDRGSLTSINPYSPSLACAWMLQAAMSSSPDAPPPSPDFIIRLLGKNFEALAAAGDAAARPFLRDTLQFGGLAATLARQVVADPAFSLQIVSAVGPRAIAAWTGHFAMLGLYSVLFALLAPLRPAVAAAAPSRARFLALRALDGLEYGSGLDFRE